MIIICGYYQVANTKMGFLRTGSNLRKEDFIKIDKPIFSKIDNYSAKFVLEYIKKNEEKVNAFIIDK
jgi:hypothetical protein